MALDFPKALRDTFDVRNPERARQVTEVLASISRNTQAEAGMPGSPGTVPLIPSAKALNIVVVDSTPYTLGTEDVLLVDDDTVGGDVTINLLAAASAFSYPRWIKKLGSTGNVIIDPDGSEVVDDELTVTLSIPKSTLAILADGSNWHIL